MAEQYTTISQTKEGLTQLKGYTDTELAKKQDKLVSGTNIKTVNGNSLLGSGNIEIQGGGTVTGFLATYGVTTAQEIIAHLENGDPLPFFVERNGSYYTVTTAVKQDVNKVILRSFATISGNYYMFMYTITDGAWSATNLGFQPLLTSGTNIKTINGESLLGSGNIEIQGGGTITIDDALSNTSLNPVQNRVLSGVFESVQQTVGSMQTDVAINTAAIDVLNGSGDGSVSKQIGDAIDAVVDGAPDTFNTLKEISDWIEQDESGTAALVNRVSSVETALGGHTVGADVPVDAIFTDTVYDDTELRNRIAALEAKLVDFDEIRLQMTDGANTVDKVVLAKPYVAPTPPTPSYNSMFELPNGFYDANGNFLGEDGVDIVEDYAGDTPVDRYGVEVTITSIPNGAVGLAINNGYNAVSTEYSLSYIDIDTGVSQLSSLSWISLGVVDISGANLVDYGGENLPNFITDTIYYQGDTTGAPWGQTSATINSEGVIPWQI